MWMCVYIWTSNVTCRHMQPAQTTRQHINARIKCVWILHNSITFIGMLSISHTPYTPHTVHCMHAIHFHLYCVRMANEEFGLCVVGMRLMCNVFPTWVNCLQSTANNHLQYKLNAHNAPYEQRAYSIQVKWIHFRSPHRPDSRVRIYVYYSNESGSRKNSKYGRRKKTVRNLVRISIFAAIWIQFELHTYADNGNKTKNKNEKNNSSISQSRYDNGWELCCCAVRWSSSANLL